MSDATCSNCPRPRRAAGLCIRCYQYQRRTGKLPPAERLRLEDGQGAQITLDLSALVLDRIRQLAAGEEISAPAWIRGAIALRLSNIRATRKRRADVRKGGTP